MLKQENNDLYICLFSLFKIEYYFIRQDIINIIFKCLIGSLERRKKRFKKKNRKSKNLERNLPKKINGYMIMLGNI